MDRIKVVRAGWLLFIVLLQNGAAMAAASTATGTGYGASRAAAMDDALTALASTIYVQIESRSESFYSSHGENHFASSTLATTRLPLLGTETNCWQERQEHACVAKLDSVRVLPLYQQAAARLVAEIDGELSGLDGRGAAEREQTLRVTLGRFDQLAKYRMVLAHLGGVKEAAGVEPAMGLASVRRELLALGEQAHSIPRAVERLLADLSPEWSLVVQAPLPSGSREVTPFSRAVQAELERQLGRERTISGVRHSLVGQYTHNEDGGISLSYTLVDDGGQTLRTAVVPLAAEASSSFRSRPAVLDFDHMLHNGYAVSPDFQARIATNKGERGVHFSGGERLSLMVRLTRPGYFYLVGHTRTDEGEMSYLLDLQDAPGNRRFIRYVNADEANRWIVLGEFVVHPPFGVESLQLMATEDDPVSGLPGFRYDPGSGYYQVADQTNSGVQQVRTRALQRVRETNGQTAEAVLMFTTMDPVR